MSVIIEKWPTLKIPVPGGRTSTGGFEFAILESMSVSYDISWEGTSVYGRTDAIQSYKTTGQTVSMTVATTVDSRALMHTIMGRLNRMTRPTYGPDGIIKVSPLLQVSVLNGNVYPESPFIIAPNSISVDMGDRLRRIDALRTSKVVDNNVIDNDLFGKIEGVPSRLSITISGAIINTETSKLINTLSAKPAPSTPIGTGTSPQDLGQSLNITGGNLGTSDSYTGESDP
tara:strand:+ start:1264 stop:1950 length:687 start_codon:yes stop_codon:yes gene_type:complete